MPFQGFGICEAARYSPVETHFFRGQPDICLIEPLIVFDAALATLDPPVETAPRFAGARRTCGAGFVAGPATRFPGTR